MDFDYFIIGVYCLFFFITAEMIGVALFWRFFYLVGFKVYHETINMPRPSPRINLSTVIKMEEGKFKFTSLDEALFTSRIYLFRFFRINTPFPFKMRIAWKNDCAEISARLPIGTSLFLFAWMTFWIYSSVETNDSIWGLFGFLFIFGMIAFSIFIEKRRMKEMIAELILILKTES